MYMFCKVLVVVTTCTIFVGIYPTNATDNTTSDPGNPSGISHGAVPMSPGASINVPNPNSAYDHPEGGDMIEMILKDPVLRKRLEQLQGPINDPSKVGDVGADGEGSASIACMTPGSRFQTVNLNANHFRTDVADDKETAWRWLRVNRLYGVIRDRFFVQNLEGGMMTIKFHKEDPTTRAMIAGMDEDWKFVYVLAKADLFWSMDNNYGAQHAVGKQTFPFELQLVHYKKSLGSLTSAAAEKHGILVLSVLFEAAGKINPSVDPLAAAAMMSTFPSEKFQMVHGPLDIKSLLPFDVSHIQYSGPYVSHPCSKEAKWIVFRHPRQISYKQLKQFREIRDISGRRHPGVFIPLGHQEDSEEVSGNTSVTTSNKIRLRILDTEEIEVNRSCELYAVSYTLVLSVSLIIFH
ncbi:Carbonic anhydrase 7 [Orchesella cincta]|uniref:carbonic anhydrase n=1 Tax=Orchesella cincta TaxID=48709 RepID=A0A1D2NB22_ORCCI|nr:Carbonic anhydrase 7 [Orchesella cincta]